MTRTGSSFVLSLIVGLSFALAADAAQRTFVSATAGSDANNCQRQSPCRNFAAAITAADSGGEVIVLDSGGYGAVAISKPISIIAPTGVYAGISVFSGDGIQINAGTTRVAIRGLTINGLGGANGITNSVSAPIALDDLTISNFPGFGIYVLGASGIIHNVRLSFCSLAGLKIEQSLATVDGLHSDLNTTGVWVSSGGRVTIRNASASLNSGAGFYAENGASGQTQVTIENSVAQDNLRGFVAEGGAHVTVRDSASLRQQIGFLADNIGATEMTVDRCIAAENQQGFLAGSPFGTAGGTGTMNVSNSNANHNGNGIVTGMGGIIRAFGNSVTSNDVGLNGGAGQFDSFGHNMVRGNTTEVVLPINVLPTF